MSFRPLSPASPLYVVMLGLLSALPPVGTDAGLPGLSGLQADLGITMAHATQTLTLFLLGFSVGPVLFGPLSDRYGRKPVLLLGVALFSLAAFGCALAGNLGTLLALRVVQGIGAGAAASLPAAIVRDVYHDELALSRQSMVALVNGVAPLVAPLLGALVLTFSGWRAIYTAMAVVGAGLLLLATLGYGETAPRAARPDADDHVLGAALRAYRTVLSDGAYLTSTGLLAATFGVMFAYITGSAAVFMGLLGATAPVYSALFACTAAGTIIGAASNARLSRRFGASRVLACAVIGNLLLALVLTGIALLGLRSIGLTAAIVVASNLCAGIIMPSATHAGLRNLGQVAGSAAALQRGLQMVAGAAAGGLVGLLGRQPLLGMAATMAVAATLAVGFAIASRRLTRRFPGAALTG